MKWKQWVRRLAMQALRSIWIEVAIVALLYLYLGLHFGWFR